MKKSNKIKINKCDKFEINFENVMEDAIFIRDIKFALRSVLLDYVNNFDGLRQKIENIKKERANNREIIN